jgi:hypothetical protein
MHAQTTAAAARQKQDKKALKGWEGPVQGNSTYVSSIQEPLTVRRTTQARNPIRRVHFALEFVVVGEFVVCESVLAKHFMSTSVRKS